VRSGRTPWFLAALVWVLVVAAVGSVTYLVVDRAGRGIGDTSATAPMAAPVASATPSATPTRSSSAPSPTRTRTRSATPTPRPTSTPAPPAPATSSPRASATSTPTPTRTPTPAPVSRTESFSTRGGTVVATCVDGRVRLDSITVRDGWRFEKDVEGGYVEVKFEAEEDDEIELRIGCRNGVPTLVDD
jgi:hypothetical protein